MATLESPQVRRKQRYARTHDVDVHVGQRLRLLREARGMTQTALADRLSMSFQQLQKIEQAVNRVSAGMLWHMASVLEVPVGYFFAEFGDPEASPLPTGRRGMEIARNVSRIPPSVQEAIARLVRTIAGTQEGGA